MSSKFVVRPKGESSSNVTVRMKHEVQETFDQLSIKSGRSRNELINKALEFALANLEFIDDKSENQ